MVGYRTPVKAASAPGTLAAAYNHGSSKIDKRLNTLGPLAAIPNIVLFGRVEGIRFTDGQPSSKLVLRAEGDIGDFGITARATSLWRGHRARCGDADRQADQPGRSGAERSGAQREVPD